VHAGRRELAAVFAGGCAGTLARALLGELLPHDAGDWPWATFAANLGGAFLLGWVVTRWELLPRSRYRLPLLGSGLCGALTTFSALQLELLQMLDADRIGLAATYAGATVAAGVLAVVLATSLGRRA